ncbi:cytochrome P450 [Akanthomyces lecanii RCEF 1005]|uniref:Cytochrome P450 n=1 Tax=Akanthomyces lecanii RCEF 1005 TaxID=1081108 RepID=A0A168CTM8_CORDF|nr:cytochrome P450 [Akanthomyces lecanii RCEF 1005]
MGIIEAILDRASVKSVLTFAIGALVVRHIVLRWHERNRIRRLGERGKSLETLVPWGLDFIYSAVTATANHKNLEWWHDMFSKAGRWTLETRAVNQRLIMTADPENIKAILATQFSDFGKGEPFHRDWQDFLGDSIFTTDGMMWQNSRQLIRPQFTRDRVSDLECFEQHMGTLFRAIANGGPLDGANQAVSCSANGKVLDIADLFFRYTLDVATEFLLGGDVQSLTTIDQEFAKAFNDVQRLQNILARSGDLRPWIPKASFWNGLTVMNEFVNHFVDMALRLKPEQLQNSKSSKQYTFLHAVVGTTRDRKVLRDQIVAVLLAGRDTTASTLSWAMYELARHPECVAKLRREILETVGADSLPTYDHLKNMPYLKAVINETLRLYPVVPFNVRLALKDTTLPRGGGADGTEPLAVLKDTPITYSTLVMQRRPDLYPAPSAEFAHSDMFSPERWERWHPRPHEYIPFNAGPRICIGQQFALTEMSYVLVRLFQRFDLVESHMGPIDGGKPVLKAEIVLSPGQGVHLSFHEALKS